MSIIPSPMSDIKVITFGTFDRFHLGHEAYLKQAKALGDFLIVVMARDKTVRKVKGRMPDFSEKERLKAVKNSGIADKVILGELKDKYEIILRFKPNVIALGYDQFVFTFGLRKFLIDNSIDAKIVRMNPYKPNVYKTSLMRCATAPCS